MDKHRSRRGRGVLFVLLTGLIGISLSLVAGELLVRLVHPVPSLYPRWESSRQYGWVLFANTKTIHETPGKWRFIYTINEYSYRGAPVPISNTYTKPNVVVLGDSYAFGIGVNDDDVFAPVMTRSLRDRVSVINLGVPGWGLTQEIRRYYEFGQLYQPAYVILQFCENDPDDNFESLVTVIKNGRFAFQDAQLIERLGILKHLSNSIIQRSQLYNFLRTVTQRSTKRTVRQRQAAQYGDTNNVAPPGERFYCELIDLFARDLKEKGIHLVMIAVINDLEKYPHIRSEVTALDSAGLLAYYEVGDWLKGIADYRSPEGHSWGARAHQVIGTRLSELVAADIEGRMRAERKTVH